jgi:hypothetical protein
MGYVLDVAMEPTTGNTDEGIEILLCVDGRNKSPMKGDGRNTGSDAMDRERESGVYGEEVRESQRSNEVIGTMAE